MLSGLALGSATFLVSDMVLLPSLSSFLSVSVIVTSALLVVGGQPSIAQSAPGAEPDKVYTGVKSGLELPDHVRNLFVDHQFTQIDTLLDQLPPLEARLYKGLLLNRHNDASASLKELEAALDLMGDNHPTEEKLARKALAEDYLRMGDLAHAATAYQKLYDRMHDHMSADELDEIEMPLKLLPLAAAHPAMTVEPCDPFLMQVSRNPLGLTDLPVFVDALPRRWMLDPTSPFNLMARSTAKLVGIKPSTEETVTIHTLTGKPMTVQMAVVPRFTVGGRLTLRNMTVMIFDDADYNFPKSEYQVVGVLGYPALQAMGAITVTDGATVEVRPALQISAKEPADKLTTGVPFYLDGDQVLVAFENSPTPSADANKAQRIYALDAGGQQSYLTSRYYVEHQEDFDGETAALFVLPGAAGIAPQPAYNAEDVELWAGKSSLYVHYLQVLKSPLGSASRDDLYGVLGVDFLDQLKSYTFDYRTMLFTATSQSQD